MNYGITENENKIINEILKDYVSKYSFFYYGSRIKGNFNKTSDLDILIKSTQEMPLSELVDLKEKFDISKLPYIVNFSEYIKMNENFYNLIKNDLIAIDKLY